jgi:hypothetical protein
MFFRGELISIKLKALQRGIWFRMLDRVERALIDLTIRVVDVVRSDRLARILSNAIGKLREAMKGMMDRVREIGHLLAEELSMVAKAWGNLRAKEWAKDEFYAIYLGLSILNKPAGLYL